MRKQKAKGERKRKIESDRVRKDIEKDKGNEEVYMEVYEQSIFVVVYFFYYYFVYLSKKWFLTSVLIFFVDCSIIDAKLIFVTPTCGT